MFERRVTWHVSVGVAQAGRACGSNVSEQCTIGYNGNEVEPPRLVTPPEAVATGVFDMSEGDLRGNRGSCKRFSSVDGVSAIVLVKSTYICTPGPDEVQIVAMHLQDGIISVSILDLGYG